MTFIIKADIHSKQSKSFQIIFLEDQNVILGLVIARTCLNCLIHCEIFSFFLFKNLFHEKFLKIVDKRFKLFYSNRF